MSRILTAILNGQENLRVMLQGLGGVKRPKPPRTFLASELLPDFQTKAYATVHSARNGSGHSKFSAVPPSPEALTKKWQALVTMRTASAKKAKELSVRKQKGGK